MTPPLNRHRPFGRTGLVIPPIVFRADVCRNGEPLMADQTKRLICGEWFRCAAPPVFVDCRVGEKHDSHLSALGRMLARLDISPDDVVINLEIDVREDSPKAFELHMVRRQLERVGELLGKTNAPRLVTLPAMVVATRELETLKAAYSLAGVGFAIREWTVTCHGSDVGNFDFVKLASGPTVLYHPPKMLAWLAQVAARQIPVISGGAFQGGFLVGGSMLDGRVINADDGGGQSLIAWRKAFTALCHGHGVRPANACVQYALSAPGVVAVSLGTSSVDCVAENAWAANMPVPASLWASLKEEGLLEESWAIS